MTSDASDRTHGGSRRRPPREKPVKFVVYEMTFGNPNYLDEPCEWQLPDLQRPEFLHGAALQHVYVASLARLLDEISKSDAVDAEVLMYREEAVPMSGVTSVTRRWEMRRRVRFGKVEMTDRGLRRVLAGQEKLQIEDMAWILRQLPDKLIPTAKTFDVQFEVTGRIVKEAQEAGLFDADGYFHRPS